MKELTEYVEFSYSFHDSKDGAEHHVRSSKRKESLTSTELCEMFLDFMRAAGYSESNIFNYFKAE
jgi:hypothetical protein